MHHSSQSTRRAGSSVWIAAVGAGTLAALTAASPANEVAMYETVPSAMEMADVLLGRTLEKERGGRSRSIRMKPEASSATAPGVLGFAVHFALDSDRIEAADRPFLDELARVIEMPELEGNALVVEGHTDARGADTYNDALSLRRARAVISYLVERHGISGSRLIPAGRGERELLDAADPAAGVNRRVQFYLPGAR